MRAPAPAAKLCLVPALTSVLLASALALGPRAEADASERDTSCAAADELFVGFGDAASPAALEVYIDPMRTRQLELWLEARRIAGERPGELRIELIVSRGGVAEDVPAADALRQWFMAVVKVAQLRAGPEQLATASATIEDVLRLLESQGPERVALQLQRGGAAGLARELGFDADTEAAVAAHTRGVEGRCLARQLDRDSRALSIRTMGQQAMVVIIAKPSGERLLQHVNPELRELRTQLDRAMQRTQVNPDASDFVPFGPSLGGQSSRLDQTFPETGVLVGGRALPHRLLIFVEDEEHGALSHWLEPAMRYRSDHPGELSVQLIAAGVGSRAVRLRRRLCAARSLGLEVEFLSHLAQRPGVRRLYETDLDSVLQPVADSDACSDSEPLNMDRSGEGPDGRRSSDFGHPRGAWLDGRPISRGDLESLEWQLGTSQTQGLIDWLLQPTNMAVFEF